MAQTIYNQTANERQLKRCYAGVETNIGVEVAPDFRLYGDMSLKKARSLAARREYAGTLFSRYSPVRGPVEITGQYDQGLSYEDLAILLQFGAAKEPTPTDDGNTVHGYTRVYTPDPTRIWLNTFSAELGWPGFVKSGSMLHFPEFTISGDIDDAEAVWKWSSKVQGRTLEPKAAITGAATGGSTSTVVKTAAGWTVNAYAGSYVRMTGGTANNLQQVREILSNDATTLTLVEPFPAAVVATDTFEIAPPFTASIADRQRESIAMPGTQLFIDTASAIGTTQQVGRLISFSNTFSTTAMLKRFAEDVNSYSKRLGAGEKLVSGQLKMEFDNRDQYDNWNNGTELKIRIQSIGSQINASPATNKLARIDVPRAIYDTLDEDERGENITATIAYIGFVDLTNNYPVQYTVKDKQATLP